MSVWPIRGEGGWEATVDSDGVGLGLVRFKSGHDSDVYWRCQMAIAYVDCIWIYRLMLSGEGKCRGMM